MTLGQKIKKARTEANLTQKDLADQLAVTFQTVSKWESDTNEPDLTTLRAIAKATNVKLEYLVSEEDEEPKKEEKPPVTEAVVTPPPAPQPEPEPQVTKTIIIHQKEQHVCAYCKRDIPEDDLEMERVVVRPAGRGHGAEYADNYYHKKCFAIVKKEREILERKQKEAHAKRAKKLSFGWGIVAGVVGLAGSLIAMLTAGQGVIHPAAAVGIALAVGYALFADLYCILSGSYIGDVFESVASWSIRFPGIIFSWSLEGFAWLIVMKIFFAVAGFFLGVFALLLALAISAILAFFSFPFVLIHNVDNNYADAF